MSSCSPLLIAPLSGRVSTWTTIRTAAEFPDFGAPSEIPQQAKWPQACHAGYMSPAAKPDKAPGDVKSKFREALERKRGTEQGRAADPNEADPSKVHGTNGPVHVQRTFRRKSG